MFRRLVLAAAFCATASFATWDKFPVLEAHKGEMSVGAEFIRHGEFDLMQLVPYLGSRCTVLPNFELAVLLPYYINLNVNNDNGLANPMLMARYQFLPFVNVFLDALVPVSHGYNNYSAWVFNFGVQYSQNFGVVDFGAELGFAMNAEGDNDFTPPFRLNFGAEVDLKVGVLAPFVGADALMLLGRFTEEGENVGKSFTGEMAVYPYIGLKYAVTPNVTVQASAKTALGHEDLVGSHTSVEADLKVKMTF